MSLPATATGSPGSANTVSTAAPMNVFGRQHFMSRRDQIMQARGTMSMPTSPLGRDGVSMWEELMSGGSPLAGVEQQQQRYNASPNYHNQPYPAPFLPEPTTERESSGITLDVQDQSFLQPFMSHTFSTADPPGQDFGSQASAGIRMSTERDHTPIAPPGGIANGMTLHHHHAPLIDPALQGHSEPLMLVRKKRAQVRIACTNCQKACKKCSNTRPCDRCLKYGLEDCVDSTRKARKTGVKRGPYKRRASKLVIPDAASDGHSDAADQSLEPSGMTQGGAIPGGQLGSDGVPLSRGGDQRPNTLPSGPATYHFYRPAERGRVPTNPYGNPAYTHERALSSAGQPHATAPMSGNLQPGRLSQHGIPPPRGSTFGTAMSAALHGPRWVHGQRVYPAGSIPRHGDHHGLPQTLMPETPRVPFPLSLGRNGVEDPFSRAVSPIRQMRLPGHSTWQSHAPIPVYEGAYHHGGESRAGSSTAASSPAGWNHHDLSSTGSPAPNGSAQSNSPEVFGVVPGFGHAKPQLGSLQVDVNRNVYHRNPATGSPFDLVPSSSVPVSHNAAGLAVAGSSGGGYPFSASTSPRHANGTWPASAIPSNAFNAAQHPVPRANNTASQLPHMMPSNAYTQTRPMSHNDRAAAANSARSSIDESAK